MRRVTERDTISLDDIRALAASRFGDMIKGVVDLERGILLLDADLHADHEASLLADGSTQANLWGINLYPDCRWRRLAGIRLHDQSPAVVRQPDAGRR